MPRVTGDPLVNFYLYFKAQSKRSLSTSIFFGGCIAFSSLSLGLLITSSVVMFLTL